MRVCGGVGGVVRAKLRVGYAGPDAPALRSGVGVEAVVVEIFEVYVALFDGVRVVGGALALVSGRDVDVRVCVGVQDALGAKLCG